MVWTADDIPSQNGRVVLITGANSGLGLESARLFYSRGATVWMACRSEERGRKAIADIEVSCQGTQGGGKLELLQMDISEPDSVHKGAAEFLKKHKELHVLQNNAGLMALPKREVNSKGWEMQTATNHIGHFLLTKLLLPALEKGAGRVVNVSSSLQSSAPKCGVRFGPGEYPTYDGKGAYRRWMVYGETKLMNMLFTEELQARLTAKGSRVLALAAHPGFTGTNLQTGKLGIPGLERLINYLFAMRLPQGVLSQMRACVDPEAKPADYYGPDRGMSGYPVLASESRSPANPLSKDRALAERLWKATEELLGETRSG